MEEIRELIIIGSGPAGLTAAIYAARARVSPLLLAGEVWGGQLMTTTDVENFPGFPDGITGPELMQKMMDQAKKFGTEIKFENATYVDLSSDIKIVKSGEKEYKAKAVILASGSMPRKLEIKGEQEYWGKGVSSCATCDGAFYKDRVVAVVGGGDSAMEESTFLTRFASKVYLIHRSDTFRASKIMQERALANPKIEVLYNTEIVEVLGDQMKGMNKLKIKNNKDNSEKEIDADGLFLAIGHIPVTGFLEGSTIPLDDHGYVVAVDEVRTNIDGVFVAGEIEDHEYKQAITTAASGCKAAMDAMKYLEMIH